MLQRSLFEFHAHDALTRYGIIKTIVAVGKLMLLKAQCVPARINGRLNNNLVVWRTETAEEVLGVTCAVHSVIHS